MRISNAKLLNYEFAQSNEYLKRKKNQNNNNEKEKKRSQSKIELYDFIRHCWTMIMASQVERECMVCCTVEVLYCKKQNVVAYNRIGWLKLIPNSNISFFCLSVVLYWWNVDGDDGGGGSLWCTKHEVIVTFHLSLLFSSLNETKTKFSYKIANSTRAFANIFILAWTKHSTAKSRKFNDSNRPRKR